MRYLYGSVDNQYTWTRVYLFSDRCLIDHLHYGRRGPGHGTERRSFHSAYFMNVIYFPDSDVRFSFFRFDKVSGVTGSQCLILGMGCSFHVIYFMNAPHFHDSDVNFPPHFDRLSMYDGRTCLILCMSCLLQGVSFFDLDDISGQGTYLVKLILCFLISEAI